MQREKSFYHRCEFYMLIALELLMAFTSLGYIHVPPISIALAYIPILFAGALCGVRESLLMGLAFGLTSLCKASVTYALPADAAFSPFGSGKPMESLLLSVGTRTLYGLLIGLLYRRAAESRRPPTHYNRPSGSFRGKYRDGNSAPVEPKPRYTWQEQGARAAARGISYGRLIFLEEQGLPLPPLRRSVEWPWDSPHQGEEQI